MNGTSESVRANYTDFDDALRAGAEKVSEYYNKTAETDALTFSMRKKTNICLSCYLLNFNYTLQCLTRDRRTNISTNFGARS